RRDRERTAADRRRAREREARIDRTYERRGRVDIVDPVETDAEEAVEAEVRLARADVQDVRIRGSEGQCSDRQRLRGVEDRRPVHAAVEGTPDPALSGPEVDVVRVRRIDRDCGHAAADEDVASIERLTLRRSVGADLRPAR